MGAVGTKALIATLTVASFLALSAGQALGSHVSCGDTITEDTTLDSDLVNCPGDGIVIGADNITLDLNGHTVDGDAITGCCDAGIANGSIRGDVGHQGVVIENGTVREFLFGVIFRGGDQGVVRDIAASANSAGIDVEGDQAQLTRNSADHNDGTGIRVDGQGGLVERNSGSDNLGTGILAGGEGTVVRANVTARNEFGISAGSKNRVTKNISTQNRNRGIHIDGRGAVVEHNSTSGNRANGIEIESGGNVIRHNATNNNFSGISLGEGGNNRVQRNRAFGNVVGISIGPEGNSRIEGNEVAGNEVGIQLCCGAEDNVVARNRVSDNLRGGILTLSFSTASNNRLVKNVVVDNHADGIFVGQGGAGNLLERNVADRNADDGIDVEEPATTLARNRANKNADLGIEAVPGVIDGGGNKAKGNGNRAQCLNIDCK